MTTEAINSIGYTSQTLQRAPATISRAAAALSLEPVVRINGVPHFSDQQIDRLREYFAQKDEARNG